MTAIQADHVELLWEERCIIDGCAGSVVQYNLSVGGGGTYKLVQACTSHQVLFGQRPENLKLLSKEDVLGLRDQICEGFEDATERGYLVVRVGAGNLDKLFNRYKHRCEQIGRPFVVCLWNGKEGTVVYRESALPAPPLERDYASKEEWESAASLWQKACDHAKRLRRWTQSPNRIRPNYKESREFRALDQGKELATEIARVEMLCASWELLTCDEVMES